MWDLLTRSLPTSQNFLSKLCGIAVVFHFFSDCMDRPPGEVSLVESLLVELAEYLIR
jgi:hypothetical protein